MRLLVVLQNAYTRKRQELPEKVYQRWLEGIWKPGGAGWQSHTGKRLVEMLPDGVELRVINSTSEVGDTPGSVFTHDLAYIQDAIDDFNPDKILACGYVAKMALLAMEHNYIDAPHPAWRFLSKQMTADIKRQLSK